MSTAELTGRLARARVPAAEVSQMAAVVAHPQLAARDRWRRIGTEHAEVQALLPPATFTDVEAPMGDVPALGEHTAALLAEVGRDAAGVADLLSRGVAREAWSAGDRDNAS